MRELSGAAKAGYFLIGLFGSFPGVLFAWLMGKDGWGWSEGGKMFAWIGCLFFVILSIIMMLTGSLVAVLALLTGNGTVTIS